MYQVKINLFKLSELNSIAQQKAISEHTEFLESMPVECENEEGELIDEYMKYEESEVIENIEINDYIYFEDGSLSNCTTYTGTHPKTGKTELELHGSIYEVI